MTQLRSVNTHFWKDGFIADCTPLERYIFLYLLTNEATTLAGCYELSLRRIMFDTGTTRAVAERSIGKFQDAGKIEFHDGWLVLNSFHKHQNLNGNMGIAAGKILIGAPEWVRNLTRRNLEKYGTVPEWFPNDSITIKGREVEVEVEVEDEREAAPTEAVSPKTKRPQLKKATPLPDDFEITTPMREWFAKHCPGLNIEEETRQFKDRCLAKGTEYKDWIAGWRTQMSNAVKWSTAPKTKTTDHQPTTGYDPKKDINHPDYEMPPKRLTFDRAADYFFVSTHNDGTIEKYEQMKANWLEFNKKYEDEIEEYEHGHQFRQRFGKAEQGSTGAGISAGGSH